MSQAGGSRTKSGWNGKREDFRNYGQERLLDVAEEHIGLLNSPQTASANSPPFVMETSRET